MDLEGKFWSFWETLFSSRLDSATEITTRLYKVLLQHQVPALVLEPSSTTVSKKYYLHKTGVGGVTGSEKWRDSPWAANSYFQGIRGNSPPAILGSSLSDADRVLFLRVSLQQPVLKILKFLPGLLFPLLREKEHTQWGAPSRISKPWQSPSRGILQLTD